MNVSRNWLWIGLTIVATNTWSQEQPNIQLATVYINQGNVRYNQKPDWEKFIDHYLPSLGLSTLAGIITGGLTKYVDKKISAHTPIPYLLWIIISWKIEIEVRKSAIKSLQNDMNSSHIPQQKSLMHSAAWIASWLAYIGL